MKTHSKKSIFLEKTYKTTSTDRSEIIFAVRSIIRKYNIVPLISDYEVTLVTDEAITNAMEHGNRWNSMKSIAVSVWLEEEKVLHLSIEDEGEGFNYANLRNEFLRGDKLAHRGRGLFIINKFCRPVWKKEGRLIELEICLQNNFDINK